MSRLLYEWQPGGSRHALEMIFVEGTRGQPFLFGEGSERRAIEVPDFFIGHTLVTQGLWSHIMGEERNPACNRGERKPQENISWNDVTGPEGFLQRLNASPAAQALLRQHPASASLQFRLPSETEWEYAARGGPHWRDEFRFSGGNDIGAVAWFKDNSGNHTHDAAGKAPNQLGLCDMSGNLWEWCEDCWTKDLDKIPANGAPRTDDVASDRVLRGGCFHNWAIHCTVSKRYAIARDAHDGCIGLRLALSAGREQ